MVACLNQRVWQSVDVSGNFYFYQGGDVKKEMKEQTPQGCHVAVSTAKIKHHVVALKILRSVFSKLHYKRVDYPSEWINSTATRTLYLQHQISL